MRSEVLWIANRELVSGCTRTVGGWVCLRGRGLVVFYGICAVKFREMFDSSELAWPCGFGSCFYQDFLLLLIISIILLALSHTILFTSNWECFFL